MADKKALEKADDLKWKLERVVSDVERIIQRYDPEHDLIPNAPRVTHTDSVALDGIVALANVVMELVAEKENREAESDSLFAVAADLMTCEGCADVKIIKCKSGFYIILQTDEKEPPFAWYGKATHQYEVMDHLWQSLNGESKGGEQ